VFDGGEIETGEEKPKRLKGAAAGIGFAAPFFFFSDVFFFFPLNVFLLGFIVMTLSRFSLIVLIVLLFLCMY